MMANLIAASFLLLGIIWSLTKAWAWRKAYTAARSVDFPVFLSPAHINDTWWLMLHPLLLPMLNTLPRSWTVPWLSLSQVWNIWKFGYEPFQGVNADTLVLATPQGNVLWTCDAKLCHQFETTPSKSRVPVDAIKFFEVYGPAIGTTEGSEWKTYRKVVTSAFTPATHTSVWKETVRHTTGLIEHWSTQGRRVRVLKHSTSRLALHVISAVFFNKHLEWNDHSLGYEPAPSGHKISFEQAMFTVVARLGVLAVTPRALLGKIPIPRVREAYIAFQEWGMYMKELREAASARLAEDADGTPKNVLESIILAGKRDADQKSGHTLSEESVTGNIFFTIMAGHETVGNALAFALYLLAIYPEYQEKIWEDLQPLLNKRPWEEWTLEQEYQTLQGGWIGAVLKEVLRPYAVVSFITRRVVSPMNVVDSNGDAHLIPANTIVSMDYAAVFRKPTIWKARPDISSERRNRLHHSPALDFDPSRWLTPNGTVARGAETVIDSAFEEVTEENNTNSGSGPPFLFPFGQGPRTCPGRTFAYVELAAVIATIVKDYKLDLVVDERVVQECEGNEKIAWEKTRDEAIKTLYDKIKTNITIELDDELPVQLVERK